MAQLNSTNVYGSLAVTGDISEGGTQLSSKYAPISHTHNYAGSSSAGGAANSVVRATFGNSSNGEHNANNITSNGLWYYSSNGPSGLGEKSTDGALYSQAYSDSWVGQIAQDYRNGNIFVRGKNNGTWTAWKKVDAAYADTAGSAPASDVYAWAKASTKPTYTASEVGAAASEHTHSTSIAASSGTNQVTLAANTKYAITAGGTSYVFTTPPDTNTWRGIQDNLTSDSTTDSLSAAQGKALKGLVDAKGTYSKPSTGIPKTDLASAVQTSLGKADTALQSHQTVSNKDATLSWGTAKTVATIGSTDIKVSLPANPNTWRPQPDWDATSGDDAILNKPSSLPASDVYGWAKASTKPTYTASEVGAATSGHTHDTTIAASTGTSQVTLSANTKYSITAGGTSYVFTTPAHQDISGKADKASITAGTAGTSSATSGSTLAVPYVTMNTQGIVTGYGTHTHTVTGFLTSHNSYTIQLTDGTNTGTAKALTSGTTTQIALPTKIYGAVFN